MPLSRRAFLGMTLGAVGAALGAKSLPPALRDALARPAPLGATLSDIQHVVIFMQENRSFDHYFGTLSGVRGFADPNAFVMSNGQSVFFQPDAANAAGYELPFRLDTTRTSGQCVADLSHSWSSLHGAWNNGKQNTWLPTFRAANGASGPLTMGYYTRADLPFHYALADAFTTCDAYHCSVMGPTNPNRLYLWTGMIDPNATGGGPVIDNTEPAAGFRWTTYPERLQAAGVTWKVYQQADNFDDNALAWFAQYKTAPTTSPLFQNGMARGAANAFQLDVANNTLPQVSWIVAPTAQSEHPTATPAAGADLLYNTLQALAANPTVWNSTVFLYCFDENDGFFDHVVPPTAPAGTPGEFVGGLPIGLGFRVPMIVVSPFSRGGAVCSDLFDHTSIIRFLETRFGVQEPNISAWRRSVCGDLTSALDLATPNFTFPVLPTTSAGVTLANQQCATLPTPSVPTAQALPAQEAGTRPQRPLGYQPNVTASVNCGTGRIVLAMQNTGTRSIVYNVGANAFRTDGPWTYTVAPGQTVSDFWSAVAVSGGPYSLSVYGPNGFNRTFKGNISAVCAAGVANPEVAASIDGLTDSLTLTMTNAGSATATITVTATAYRTDGPWVFTVAPGQTVSNTWSTATTGGWYSFSAADGSGFVRSFAGHIEHIAATPPAPTPTPGPTLTPSPTPVPTTGPTWDFNGSLASANGAAALVAGFCAPAKGASFSFSTATINGQAAQVATFTRGTYFTMTHGLPANGGGSFVNQYTLIMDVMFPSRPTGWASLWQTNQTNANDADWYINPSGGLGISSVYGGAVQNNIWYRLALVVDLVAGTFTSYLNGTQVNRQTSGFTLNGRWSLDPTALLFADFDSENAGGSINCVQLRGRALSAAEVAALGGPSAAGIPR